MDEGITSIEVETVDEIPPNVEYVQTMGVREFRQSAYQSRADPLFFKWQRGTATEQEWLDEIEAIRKEFPI